MVCLGRYWPRRNVPATVSVRLSVNIGSLAKGTQQERFQPLTARGVDCSGSLPTMQARSLCSSIDLKRPLPPAIISLRLRCLISYLPNNRNDLLKGAELAGGRQR